MDREIINYSQCWEDPHVLTEALSIHPTDHVLSITSGGDNTLHLLLAGAKNVDAVDFNPVQNHLLELKKVAPKCLTYEEYLELMGVRNSKRRYALFEKVRTALSPAADTWFFTHRHLIEKGVIHCGRFERFTVSFAHYILPLIHSKQTILEFLTCNNIQEQGNFYHRRWNSRRWRFFFGLASTRLMLKRFARQKGMFSYAEGQTAADVYRQRLERHLVSVPVHGNYFLRYSLTGEYDKELPPYLEEHGYQQLRKMPEVALSITTENLLDYLRSVPDNTFSKFNLSDIFEALSSEDSNSLWEQIIRTAKSGAVIAYWNNLVQRSYPPQQSVLIKTDENQLRNLRAKNRVFFYDNFYAHTIFK
jgi:S-adenosylmethionine-diacylglycerol 3-amino-3-carboxypropyl transferase